MQRQAFLLFSAVVLSSCQTTTDPAEGGFISGVSALNSGAYEERAAALNEQEAAERARQAELQRELSALQSEYAALQRTIRQQRADLTSAGTAVSSQLDARIASTLNTGAPSGDASARLNVLRQSISSARSISAELAELSS